MGARRGRPSPGELRLGNKALKPAAGPRMENRIDGTGTRAGNGKPRPLQTVGKLRNVNLASAAGRQPSRHGLVGIKPSGGPNPEDGSSRAARPGEDRPDLTRCGDEKPHESHRGRPQFTRRPGRANSKGRPKARRDADPGERNPDERRRSRNPTKRKRESVRKVNLANSGMTAPTTIPGSRADAGREASSSSQRLVRLKALKGTNARHSCPTRLSKSGRTNCERQRNRSRCLKNSESRPTVRLSW
jgi:hypothetical protein